MLIRLIRDHLRAYRKILLAVIALQFVQTVAVLYLPTLNADIIDKGVLPGDTGYIMRVGGVMLAVTLGQIIASGTAVYFGARTAMAAGRDIRAGVFRHVMGLSTREVGRFGAPSLITRTTNDVQQVQMLALMSFTLMVAAPIMCVGGVIMALRQDVPLSGLLLVIVPVLAIAVVLIIRKMRPLFRGMQTKVDAVNRVLREQIAGIRVIRAFVRDARERERFDEANVALRDLGIGAGRLMSLMFPSVMLVINASQVAVLWFGGHRIDGDHMQIGALTAFLSYLMYILMSVMMATFMFIMVPRAEVCAERIQEVLDTPTSLTVAADATREAPRRGELEIRDASFSYPGAQEPVLRGVRLTAAPGQTTAIVGSTGAGKTTLLHLIPRLCDVTEGAVLVGGVDVRQLHPQTLSRMVGLAPQRPYLFAGTIATNLRYGNPDATDAQLWHALEVAQARDFVEQMDAGLDSPIAQGGANVSGGQRQRLAIARMLVAEPEIYLFDDSFSALDLATDARLRAALAPVTRDATVVIVAQRVSTIRDADLILVLEDGAVVGRGTHAELLAGDPTYQEIVSSQLSAEEAA